VAVDSKKGPNKRKRLGQHSTSPNLGKAGRKHQDLTDECLSPEISLRSKKRGSLAKSKEPIRSLTSPHEHVEINPEFWSPWPSSGALRKEQQAENHTVERGEATFEVITIESPVPSTVLLRRSSNSIQANLTQILQIAGLSESHQKLAFIAEHIIIYEVDNSDGNEWVDLPTALKVCGILVLPELIPHLVSHCRAPSQLDGPSIEAKQLAEQPQLQWKPGFKTITLKERTAPNRILLYMDYIDVRVNLTDILKSAGFDDFKHINSWIKLNQVNYEPDKTSRRIRWIDISTALRVCDKILPELKPYLLSKGASQASIAVGEDLSAQNHGIVLSNCRDRSLSLLL
jgi:hypothetical protein